MLLTIIDINGPLFVLDASAEVTQFCTTHYPQFAKRSVGLQLSVEEVHFLLQLEQEQPPPRTENTTSEESAGKEVTVCFASATAAAQFHTLHKTYASDCALYARLTLDHGYHLRHGSAFGASYIAYRDLSRHGDSLIFTNPLSELEKVRAVRVARSVGKEAVAASLSTDGSCVTLTALSDLSVADGGPCGKRPRRV